jgi:hypothetical protein
MVGMGVSRQFAEKSIQGDIMKLNRPACVTRAEGDGWMADGKELKHGQRVLLRGTAIRSIVHWLHGTICRDENGWSFAWEDTQGKELMLIPITSGMMIRLRDD